MLLSLLTVPLALLVSTVSGYANPLSCSGVCNNGHDPALIRRASDGKYFRFATAGGIQIHTASSIQGPWVFAGEALVGGSKIDNPGKTDMWAPDVTLVGNTYYMYYSVSSFGTQDSVIGLATSTTLEPGSWTDQGTTGISSSGSKPYNAIDANLFVGSDGSYKLNFGSFWHGLYQAPMKSPPKAAAAASTNIAYEPAGDHPIEAPYMIFKDNYYYLFFSAGVCCGYDKDRPAAGAEYKVKVCRSSSSTSGFVDKAGVSCLNGGGTVVLESHGNVYGPGGASVYNDPGMGWVLIYHHVDITIGYADGDKKFGVNKLVWSGGWPTV